MTYDMQIHSSLGRSKSRSSLGRLRYLGGHGDPRSTAPLSLEGLGERP